MWTHNTKVRSEKAILASWKNQPTYNPLQPIMIMIRKIITFALLTYKVSHLYLVGA